MKHSKRRQNLVGRLMNRQGFTLIELLIVIAILGILAGVAVPLYLGQRAKAMQTEAKTNLESIRLFEEQYFAENGCYYRDGSGTCTDTTISGVAGIQAFLPGFRPGHTSALKFDYQIVLTAGATQYTATATGKAGTPVEGSTFSIDQNNNRLGF